MTTTECSRKVTPRAQTPWRRRRRENAVATRTGDRPFVRRLEHHRTYGPVRVATFGNGRDLRQAALSACLHAPNSRRAGSRCSARRRSRGRTTLMPTWSRLLPTHIGTEMPVATRCWRSLARHRHPHRCRESHNSGHNLQAPRAHSSRPARSSSSICPAQAAISLLERKDNWLFTIHGVVGA